MGKQLIGIFFFVVGSLFPNLARAGAQGVHIVAATNNLLTTYSAAFPQLALTQISPTIKHLYVFNGCSGPVALTFTNIVGAVAPSSSVSTNPMQVFVGGSSSTQLNFIGGGKFLWLRSDSGSSCTSGDVIVNLW